MPRPISLVVLPPAYLPRRVSPAQPNHGQNTLRGRSKDTYFRFFSSLNADFELRYCFDDDFTVLVGQDEVRFVIHEDVFRDQSEFFRAACSRDFKEGKEKVIRMPEADPETFRSYMQWAYRGEIVVMNSQEIAEPNDQSSRLQRRLGELFTLASFLGDLQLKNSVTDKIISVLKCNSSELAAPLVTHLYEHTPDECKLRRYILDWFLYKPTGTWLETNRSLLPAAFLGDIAVGWAKVNFDRSKLIDPHTQPQCFYHERGTLTFFCPCNSSKT